MSDIGLIVADPGHFDAALVQREMYPNLSPKVHVYAPLGPDLIDYLTRISRFNTRPERPTRGEWRCTPVPISSSECVASARHGRDVLGPQPQRNSGDLGSD